MATEGSNPFDTSKKEMMSGVSITPNADAYGQVSSTFYTPSFNATNDSSIFMWVFIPDEILYDLSIEIKGSAQESVVWTFDSSTLTEKLISAYSLNGWKLFELCFSDAEQSLGEKNLEDVTFGTIKISYQDALSLGVKYSNNYLSFYHVYIAKSFSSESTILKSLSYSYYNFDENFTDQFENLYVDDDFDFVSVNDFFSYLIVGKTDLKKYSNNDYTITISLTSPSSDETTLTSQMNYVFSESGRYVFNITVSEYRSTGSKQVVSTSYSVYINTFSLGSFSSVNLQIQKGEVRVVSFYISENFVFDGELVVECNDKSVAEITYYVTHNTCQIRISGQKRGKTTISVSASGHRDGTDKVETYSTSTNIEVGDKSISLTSVTILWISLSVYLIVFLIYVIMMVTKAKKSGVR
jgi:hypothetical protein